MTRTTSSAISISIFLLATLFQTSSWGAERSLRQPPNSLKVQSPDKKMKIVFLNASQNRDGNTASLAKATLKGLEIKSVNLVDFHLDQIGQVSKLDQKKQIIEQIEKSQVLIVGTPVYWSDMTGYLKTFIDRLDLDTDKDRISGADVYLIIQGTEPSDAITGITTVIEHVCRRFGLNYKGLIRNNTDASAINKKLTSEFGTRG
ncbi:MAG: flavodoxin family protein [Proteobacteria bacterium]|nr:MAG: flavodoxin family protein [Pseudomonadota bacterium]